MYFVIISIRLKTFHGSCQGLLLTTGFRSVQTRLLNRVAIPKYRAAHSEKYFPGYGSFSCITAWCSPRTWNGVKAKQQVYWL